MHALIVYGGWEGHEPARTTELLAEALTARGHGVTRRDSLAAFDDANLLAAHDVIVPNWTMGALTGDQARTIEQAVRSGVGLAGFHGGAGDAFRNSLDYMWLIGGQFVGHPYVGEYEVRRKADDPIVAELPAKFLYDSEQYYMLVDPAVRVLAETTCFRDGQDVQMPVIWTRTWGAGRVFYSALGHKAQEFIDYPAVLEMTLRGIEWAANANL